MTGEPKRWSRVIIGGILALLLVGSLAIWAFQPGAVDVAKAASVEHGWQAGGADVTGFVHTGNVFFNEHQTVDLTGTGPEAGKRARVSLSRPVYFLGWRVVNWEALP